MSEVVTPDMHKKLDMAIAGTEKLIRERDALLQRATSAEALLIDTENKAAEYKSWAAKAVKEADELRAKIAELEAENAKLKKENDELEAEATANFI